MHESRHATGSELVPPQRQIHDVAESIIQVYHCKIMTYVTISDRYCKPSALRPDTPAAKRRCDPPSKAGRTNDEHRAIIPEWPAVASRSPIKMEFSTPLRLRRSRCLRLSLMRWRNFAPLVQSRQHPVRRPSSPSLSIGSPSSTAFDSLKWRDGRSTRRKMGQPES
jgi:hypothetical protein